MNQTAEISLVKQTPFEELATRLIEERSNSDLEITRKRQIIKEIISVYCFMKKQLGIEHKPLSIEQFKVIKEQLHKTACEKIEAYKKKWWWLGLKPPGIRRWEHFLRFGYFDPIKHPSGIITYGYLSYSSLEAIFNGNGIHPNWDATPSNLKDLTLTLFKERFERKNE